jgi:CheY-like chemotaxis protein/predicted regulator of Ras-like GTPase activity (Roadblock/LC7/MglB family)
VAFRRMSRILIVDDEAELVSHIAEYLTSYPGEFEVTACLSAEEGLEVLTKNEVDLLLTDIRLPGMDGIELVHEALELFPGLRVIVMTAFGSEEMRDVAETVGAIDFIEKPLDLEDLRLTLHETLQEERNRVGGLDIVDVLQFLALGGYTRVIRVQSGKEKGTLVFDGGELVHVATRRLKGEKALQVLAEWTETSFKELATGDPRRYQRNLSGSTGQIIAKVLALRAGAPIASAGEPSARNDARTDEVRIVTSTTGAAPPANPTGAAPNSGKEDLHMAIKDHLNEFQGIEGFLGAAVFSSQGEMLDGLTMGKIDIKAVGMFANNALLNAQKATDQMGVGRGNLIQIRAPQATIIMRCLNEATDFAATSTGKAHFHTVVVMAPEGNSGMAMMILDKVVGRIADEVR